MARLAVSSLALLLVFIGGASLLASALQPSDDCAPDLISVAALSCEESPQSPTSSCCDALLYAIDAMAESSTAYNGKRCLCVYMATNHLDYDLASVYRRCGGKEASDHELQRYILLAVFCVLPCNSSDFVSLPDGVDVPSPSTSTGGSKSNGKGGGDKTKATIILIVVAILILVIIGCYFAACYFRPAAKARESPATSDSDSDESSRVIRLHRL
jgi:hypothetical protein